MIELKAIVYFLNSRYHFALIIPGYLGNAPVGFIVMEENIVWSPSIPSSIRNIVELKAREAVRKDAEQRKIENPRIYGLDKNLS